MGESEFASNTTVFLALCCAAADKILRHRRRPSAVFCVQTECAAFFRASQNGKWNTLFVPSTFFVVVVIVACKSSTCAAVVLNSASTHTHTHTKNYASAKLHTCVNLFLAFASKRSTTSTLCESLVVALVDRSYGRKLRTQPQKKPTKTLRCANLPNLLLHVQILLIGNDHLEIVGIHCCSLGRKVSHFFRVDCFVIFHDSRDQFVLNSCVGSVYGFRVRKMLKVFWRVNSGGHSNRVDVVVAVVVFDADVVVANVAASGHIQDVARKSRWKKSVLS